MLSRQVDVEGLFVVVLCLPLIVAGGWNQAATLLYGLLEVGLVEGAFCPGIDGVDLGVIIRDEVRDVAPGHVQQLQSVAVFAEHGHRLPRRDVVPGLEGGRLADLDRAGQAPDGGVVDEVIAAAHGLSLSAVPKDHAMVLTESTWRSI